MSKIYLTIDSMPGGYGGYDLNTKKAKKLMKKIVKKASKILKVNSSRAISAICNRMAITGNGTGCIVEFETEAIEGFGGIQVKITFNDFEDFSEYINQIN